MSGQYGKSAPSFLRVLPKQATSEVQNEVQKPAPIPDPTGSRFSRRVRGMNDGVLYDPSVLALVERRKSGFRVQKNSENESISPSKNEEVGNHDDTNDQEINNQDSGEAVETNNEVVMKEKRQHVNQQEKEDEESSDENDPVHRVKRSLEFTKNDEGMKI